MDKNIHVIYSILFLALMAISVYGVSEWFLKYPTFENRCWLAVVSIACVFAAANVVMAIWIRIKRS